MAAKILSPRTATLILSHAIHHLHLEAQIARSREEYEDFSIALKLLGLLCDGWNSGPGLFNLACAYATGLPHQRYLYGRAQRAEFERLELLRAIPDYDYSTEPRMDRDPMDGRRHYGNDFAKRENRLRNLAAKAIAADDSNSSCNADADIAAAGFGLGDWTGADSLHIAPSRTCIGGQSELVASDRRKPPKSVRSPAQQRQLAGLHDRAAYFGA
jgi:hypothetical protein